MRQTDTKRAATEIILRALAASAVLSLALLAPNAVGPIMRMFRSRGIPPKKARAVIHYLKRHGLVIMREERGTLVAAITEKGKHKLQRFDFDRLAIPALRRWDGRWRFVAFDIPEKRKTARDALRQKLQELGFIQVQRSFWLHPYPCRNEVDFAAEVLQLSPYLWLGEANAIDHEDYLKKKFRLS